MIIRQIGASIQAQIEKFPIIVLTGPRQSGKTTLLKTIFPNYTYISLEDPDHREFAHSDPKGFLTLYSDKIIFDEAQHVPKLFSYIQTKVDDSPMDTK